MRSGVTAAALLAVALSISRIDSRVFSGANNQLPLALLTLAIGVVAVLVQLRRGEANSGLREMPRSPVLLWAAWPLVGLLGAGGANDPALAAVTSLGFLACGLGVHLLVQERQLAAMVTLGMFTALVISVTAASAWVWSDFDQHPDHLRLLAIEANSLSQTFLWLVFWIACALTYRTLGLPRRPLIMLGGAAALGLALTQSRTAALAAVVGVAATIVAARVPKLRPLLVVSAAVLVVISGVFLAQTVAADGPISAAPLGGLRRMTGRADVWPAVADAISARPWFGYGFGADEAITAGQAADASLGWRPRHTHNLFLHLLVVTGWAGLLAFCSGLLMAVVRAWRNSQHWVIGVVFVLVVDGVAEAVLIDPSLAWASVVAVAAASAQSAATVEAPTGRRQPANSLRPAKRLRPANRIRPALVVGSAVVLGAVALTASAEWARLPFRARCGDDESLIAASTPLTLDGPPVVVAPDGAAAVRCLGRGAGALSVTMFVTPDSQAQGGPARLVSLSDGLGWDDIDFEIGVEATDLVVRVRSGEGVRTDTVVADVFADVSVTPHSGPTKPVHLGVVVESTQVTVYVDGGPVAQWDIDKIRFASWGQDRSLTLGNESSGLRPFVGTVRLVTISGGALPAAELRELARS